MHVNETRCTGCGACSQVCPTDAIRIVDSLARIDVALCSECQVCIEECLSGAIVVTPPTITSFAAMQSSCVQTAPVVGTPTPTMCSLAIAPALGAALTFLGHEIPPRAASAVVESILNHEEERTGFQTLSIREDQPCRWRRRGARANR
jgi:NAD-dependent dihydropyrimidine dehydrogenase PreA subunit